MEFSGSRMIDLGEHSAMAYLGFREDAIQRLDGGAGYVGFVQEFQPALGIALEKHFAQDRDERRTMLDSIGILHKPRIVRQFRFRDGGTKTAPDQLAGNVDDHKTIGGLKALVRNDSRMCIAPAPWNLPLDQVIASDIDEAGDFRFQ